MIPSRVALRVRGGMDFTYNRHLRVEPERYKRYTYDELELGTR